MRSPGPAPFTPSARGCFANTRSTSALDQAFTIHDREDSADLMNLVRHELGFSKTDKRFPMKGTCLAIYSRAVNAETPLAEVLGSAFPWCAEWEAELQDPVRRVCRGQAEAERARLRRPAALLGADDDGGLDRRRSLRALRPRAGRRVSGHQPSAGLDPAASQADRARPHRGRRRRAVDLFVPRRDRAQHPRFSRTLHAEGRADHAGTQLPLDQADPRRRQCGDRSRAPSASPRTSGRTAHRGTCRRW